MRSSANWGTVVVAMMMSASVHAVPKALHDPSELTGPIRVVDFEGSAAPSSIADGTTINGITFSAPSLSGTGLTLSVENEFDAFSGENYLGTTDLGVIQGTDEITLDFAPTSALAMYFLTGDTLVDDDLTLAIDGFTASLVADVFTTLADGSLVYFLGVSDAMTLFTTATVSGTNDFFLYNIDDVSVAVVGVPAPGPSLLLAFGALLLCRRRTVAA